MVPRRFEINCANYDKSVVPAAILSNQLTNLIPQKRFKSLQFRDLNASFITQVSILRIKFLNKSCTTLLMLTLRGHRPLRPEIGISANVFVSLPG